MTGKLVKLMDPFHILQNVYIQCRNSQETGYSSICIFALLPLWNMRINRFLLAGCEDMNKQEGRIKRSGRCEGIGGKKIG
jgi:hypothetical protein